MKTPARPDISHALEPWPARDRVAANHRLLSRPGSCPESPPADGVTGGRGQFRNAPRPATIRSTAYDGVIADPRRRSIWLPSAIDPRPKLRLPPRSPRASIAMPTMTWRRQISRIQAQMPPRCPVRGRTSVVQSARSGSCRAFSGSSRVVVTPSPRRGLSGVRLATGCRGTGKKGS